MIYSLRTAACLLLLISLLPTTWAQRRGDPLTPQEGDQLREAAQVPAERIKLYIDFSRARLAALEKMRADPKTANRPRQTHDQLQNFLDVYDELNDNIETFVERKADLRKPLKGVIDADTEFQARLRALKSSIDSSKEETSQYEFILNSLIESVDSAAQDHRQLLGQQEEAFKHKKK
jgi:hypothetical protein